jgi:hypothetical protein
MWYWKDRRKNTKKELDYKHLQRVREDQVEVEIFNYRVWDQLNGAHIIPPRKATREFIEKAGGSIIEASRTVVEEKQIDPEGQEKLP